MLVLKNKSTFYNILFFLCIGVSYLNYFELTFMVWTFTFLITIKNTYAKELIKCLFPFIIILLIAIITSFFYESSVYSKIKDFTYLFKPILGILVGYQLLCSYPKEAFKNIIKTY